MGRGAFPRVPAPVRMHVCCLPVCLLPERGVESSARKLHGVQFFKMSSLEQRLSRIEEKLKQENEEARPRIDLNIDMSPQRSRPRPSEYLLGRSGESVTSRIAGERSQRWKEEARGSCYLLTG